MFVNPLIVGVKQFSDWTEADSPESVLYGLGNNTGNMMFTQSLVSSLKGAIWGSFAIDHADLEGRDAIVIASANWVNNFEDYGWLADRLEKTKLPVFLVGIGAQSTLDKVIPNVSAGTRRLLSLVTDRSKFISTRGPFSSMVLEELGFKNSIPTGCPSLLLAGHLGPNIRVSEFISYENCCIHATRHGFQYANSNDSLLYKFAFENKIDIVLQSETPDICFSQCSIPGDKNSNISYSALIDSYGVNDLGLIKVYLERHGKSFANIHNWLSYMKSKSFCFGTRIHGTIASILAGTPALLIVTDSRTQELAEVMTIPHILQNEFNKLNYSDVDFLYRQFNWTDLSLNYSNYRKRFKNFFESNKLVLI